MNRRDRAELAVAEIEALAERGEGLTHEQVERAILNHALGPSELVPLGSEVRRVLRERGYSVPPPDPVSPLWYLLGLALLPLLLLVADWYLGLYQ